MKYFNKVIQAIFLTVLTACSEDGLSSSNQLRLENISHPVLKKVVKVVSKNRRCNYKNRFQNCQMETLSYSPAALKGSSKGQRILVLEGLNYPKSLFFINKGRILNFLKVSEFGSYSEFHPKVRAPKILTQAINTLKQGYPEVLQDEYYNLVGKQLLNLHHKIEYIAPEVPPVSHGEYIFEWLAYYNPSAQFLFAEIPEIPNDLYCSFDKKIGLVKFFYDRAYRDLKKYMDRYGINYVNISYNSDQDTILKNLSQLCNRSSYGVSRSKLRQFIKIKNDFAKKISQGEHVYAVQSVSNDPSRKAYADDKDYLQSCDQNSNIIKVGYYNDQYGYADRGGSYIDEDILPYNQSRLIDCANLFINGGIDEQKAQEFRRENPFSTMLPDGYDKWWDEYSLKKLYYGIYQHPEEAMATSWAAPLALSMINFTIQDYIRRYDYKPSAQEIKTMLNGKMFDPLKYELFLVFDR
ncbi:MAG: hypothetical protein ISR65_04460 [Bacteriovoracaceae bacterium]|nr:hypothetical protein [Bacteriovoracaceae bacterium]